jgi:hypothetical protein
MHAFHSTQVLDHLDGKKLDSHASIINIIEGTPSVRSNYEAESFAFSCPHRPCSVNAILSRTAAGSLTTLVRWNKAAT